MQTSPVTKRIRTLARRLVLVSCSLTLSVACKTTSASKTAATDALADLPSYSSAALFHDISAQPLADRQATIAALGAMSFTQLYNFYDQALTNDSFAIDGMVYSRMKDQLEAQHDSIVALDATYASVGDYWQQNNVNLQALSSDQYQTGVGQIAAFTANPDQYATTVASAADAGSTAAFGLTPSKTDKVYDCQNVQLALESCGDSAGAFSQAGGIKLLGGSGSGSTDDSDSDDDDSTPQTQRQIINVNIGGSHSGTAPLGRLLIPSGNLVKVDLGAQALLCAQATEGRRKLKCGSR